MGAVKSSRHSNSRAPESFLDALIDRLEQDIRSEFASPAPPSPLMQEPDLDAELMASVLNFRLQQKPKAKSSVSAKLKKFAGFESAAKNQDSVRTDRPKTQRQPSAPLVQWLELATPSARLAFELLLRMGGKFAATEIRSDSAASDFAIDRRALRRERVLLLSKYHPDHSGKDTTEVFQSLLEALAELTRRA